MLKKLRNKFILTNMLLMGIALLIILILVCVYYYRDLRGDLINAMRLTLARRDGFRQEEQVLGIKEDTQEYDNIAYAPMFAVLYDAKSGAIDLIGKDAEMELATLQAAIDYAVAADGEYGVIEEYNLFYYKTVNDTETRMAFASNSYIYRTVRNWVLILCSIYLGALCFILTISVVIAKLATKPIALTWDQQKRFIADASHSLKTPITVILANNSIMCAQKDAPFSERRQWLDSTRQEAEEMRQLVDEMLMLTQSELNVTSADYVDVDLSKLVEMTLLQFEAVAFDQKKRMSVSVQPDIRIRGNEKNLKQMLMALMDNALKYEPEGGQVAVTLEKQRIKPFTKIWLRVKNEQSYIVESERAHIFDRFYRASAPRTPGHGLGLSIAQSVAEAHNALITVSSAKNNGTEFCVTFG